MKITIQFNGTYILDSGYHMTAIDSLYYLSKYIREEYPDATVKCKFTDVSDGSFFVSCNDLDDETTHRMTASLLDRLRNDPECEGEWYEG